jgi:hypothetical protein
MEFSFSFSVSVMSLAEHIAFRIPEPLFMKLGMYL